MCFGHMVGRSVGNRIAVKSSPHCSLFFLRLSDWHVKQPASLSSLSNGLSATVDATFIYLSIYLFNFISPEEFYTTILKFV